MIIEWTNTYAVLEEFAIRLRNLYQDKLIRDDKIATGELLNSVEYRVEKGNQAISVVLELEDYYKWVEEGIYPYGKGTYDASGKPVIVGKFPPVDAIRNWISTKPVIPDERDGRIPTENQLVYLIGRKIASAGIEPGYQLRDSIKETMEDFEAAIEEAIGKDVSAYIDILFTEFL